MDAKQLTLLYRRRDLNLVPSSLSIKISISKRREQKGVKRAGQPSHILHNSWRKHQLEHEHLEKTRTLLTKIMLESEKQNTTKL